MHLDAAALARREAQRVTVRVQPLQRLAAWLGLGLRVRG